MPICTWTSVISNPSSRRQSGKEDSYQEHNRDVKKESNNGIGQQCPHTNVVDVVHGEVRDLKEQGSDTVHDSTDRSEVVEGDKRVHLVLSRAKKALNHDQASGLKDDTTKLEEESGEDESDLTERGNDDTKHDNADVHQDLEVDRSHAHTPSSEKNSNGGSSLRGKSARETLARHGTTDLEHLDEGNTQIQISHITADQTQTEEKTDRNNSTKVDTASHLHGLPSIEQSGGARQKPGHEGRKCQMPCCEDDS